MKQAELDREIGQQTMVFVDEIHRFNKAQQDAFLPYVERGSIILIGRRPRIPRLRSIRPCCHDARCLY